MCGWGVPAAATHQAQGRPVCVGGSEGGAPGQEAPDQGAGCRGQWGHHVPSAQAGNVTERFTESFSGLPPRYLFL